MSTALSAATLIVAVALLWTGWKKSTWSTPLAAILSALDLVGLVLLVVSLGWLGLGIFAGANVAGFVGWGMQGAVYVDAQLSAAAALGGMQKAAARGAFVALTDDKRLASLGPRLRADLVRLLAERGRSPVEIQMMGPAVGLLYIIGEPAASPGSLNASM